MRSFIFLPKGIIKLWDEISGREKLPQTRKSSLNGHSTPVGTESPTLFLKKLRNNIIMKEKKLKDLKYLVKKYVTKEDTPITKWGVKDLKKTIRFFSILIIVFYLTSVIQTILSNIIPLLNKIVSVLSGIIIISGVWYIKRQSNKIINYFDEMEKDYKKFKNLFK
jgi:hypothetical protein